MIRFDKVSFSYNSKKILDNVDLYINNDEFLFVVGESGIGKTTLFKLMYFEEIPTSGTVFFENFSSDNIDVQEIPYLRRRIGVVFQDFKLMQDRDTFDNISLPLEIIGDKKDTIKKKVFDAASRVGLLDKLNKKPFDLSGGEQQRIAIARAIVNKPEVVIADEPTGNLDPIISMDILKLLNEINRRGTAVIIATHNFELVRKLRDKRIVQVKDQKLYEVKIRT
ncbi:MAG: ATP-binding cassette domain-containing protein [Ignavibacteriaceae bacterium]|nr:MAG: ATP-binding cassette domain-containing protein [Chlorobiota bacterium]KXK04146.1 MAG: Cell division transport system ATP-binding protein [Chlorobi bacterium OLB4]MBV6397871.1 Cell division ATP-binding protein FtsE [Ignavibacteria bacterium]MCC6886818.1 ATP-binding cassette domain-containing protein [Ignavibacteriales bacterium]MCE7953942.1 ATP-binding cassette domain-containing protein [Chlorobi bacterium CHB7]MEB2330633.1 ATP-binding cassette domain-containing protein [Ignavibacteriac